MRFALITSVSIMLSCSVLATDALSQTERITVPPPVIEPNQAVSQARQLQIDQQSSNAVVRAEARKKRVGDVLPLDFQSGNPTQIKDAIDVLRTSMRHNGTWCRIYLADVWLQPLLDIKQYDLIQDIINESFSDSRAFNDTKGIAATQLALVQLLIAQGKNDQALAAAKAYYNVCKLPDTGTAISLFAQVLDLTRAKDDPGITLKFKQQQAYGIKVEKIDVSSSQVGDLGPNVLSTVKIDPSPYEPGIKSFEQAPETFATLTAKGNLLLLADRADEARKAFQSSLAIANTKEEAAAASNVARAIRAKTGLIGPANAYLDSLSQDKK